MSVSPTPPTPAEQPMPSDILKLDVGGITFTTTYSIVCNIDGMLSAMFSGRHALAPDAEGYHFIDRDGTHFYHILNLLRSPTEFSLNHNDEDIVELEKLVDYYLLSEAYAFARVRHTPAITATSRSLSYLRRLRDRVAAYFTVGDRVLLCPPHRGWNVLLFDRKIDTVISQTVYSIWRDETAVQQRCIDFLDAVLEGTIVAISVLGNVGEVSFSVCAALRSLSGTGTDIWPDDSYAMVGQKGWGPGLAAEAKNGRGDMVTATRPATTIYKW